MLPAKKIPTASCSNISHGSSHLVQLAWKSENVVEKKVWHGNNFESRFLDEFFLQNMHELSHASSHRDGWDFPTISCYGWAHNGLRNMARGQERPITGRKIQQLGSRIYHVARFDRETFRELKEDKNANGQAIAVLLLVGL